MRSPIPTARPHLAAAAAALASLLLLLLLLLVAVAVPAAAQRPGQGRPITVSTAVASAELFQRAQRLVAQGQGQAGRAVVDSALARASEGSDAYAEALFWRASLAATAAEAERDYRVLAVEYSMSPRAADALLRLGQLELARGDRAQAIRHLERLVLEHPTSPARPRASYWMARVHFDGGDAPRACASLDAARVNARPDEGALRAQIDAYASRCAGVVRKTTGRDSALSPLATSTPAAPAPTPAPGATTTPASTGSVFAAAAPPSKTASAPNAATSVPDPPNAAPGTAMSPSASAPKASTPASGSTSPFSAAATPDAAAPAPAPPAPRASPPAARPPTPDTPHPTPSVYSVQLAAYDAAAPAEALVRRLRGRGIEARVSGTARPFRVRVGRFATSAEAEREAAALKKRGQPAWVVTETAAP